MNDKPKQETADQLPDGERVFTSLRQIPVNETFTFSRTPHVAYRKQANGSIKRDSPKNSAIRKLAKQAAKQRRQK